MDSWRFFDKGNGFAANPVFSLSASDDGTASQTSGLNAQTMGDGNPVLDGLDEVMQQVTDVFSCRDLRKDVPADFVSAHPLQEAEEAFYASLASFSDGDFGSLLDSSRTMDLSDSDNKSISADTPFSPDVQFVTSPPITTFPVHSDSEDRSESSEDQIEAKRPRDDAEVDNQPTVQIKEFCAVNDRNLVQPFVSVLIVAKGGIPGTFVKQQNGNVISPPLWFFLEYGAATVIDGKEKKRRTREMDTRESVSVCLRFKGVEYSLVLRPIPKNKSPCAQQDPRLELILDRAEGSNVLYKARIIPPVSSKRCKARTKGGHRCKQFRLYGCSNCLLHEEMRHPDSFNHVLANKAKVPDELVAQITAILRN